MVSGDRRGRSHHAAQAADAAETAETAEDTGGGDGTTRVSQLTAAETRFGTASRTPPSAKGRIGSAGAPAGHCTEDSSQRAGYAGGLQRKRALLELGRRFRPAAVTGRPRLRIG